MRDKTMKVKLLFGFILTALLFPCFASSSPIFTIKSPIANGGNIQAGAGYSSDAQQVALQPCFNASISSQSDPESYLKLQSAISFSQLENDLKINISTDANIGIFSGDAEANYFSSIKETDYSFSLNYYQYSQSTTQVALNGFGMDALNEQGKSLYDNGQNPYFGLVCGDNYISSYGQGALLMMSININFADNAQKQIFLAKAGMSFGNIFDATGSIQQIATQNNLSGSLIIEAYQKGGDPSQLSKILSKDPSGQYYALTCDLKNLGNCTQAANGLLDYATNNFSTQYSFTTGQGLTPLGVGFSTYIPIRYIGLKEPASLVTPQVQKDRQKLSTDLDEYNYYQQKLYELLYGYPVAWDTTSTIYKNIQSLYQRSQNNIQVILNPSNPEQGGRGCYDTPDACDTVVNAIESKIVAINPSDLSFLSQLQYAVPTEGAYFYRVGDADTSWAALVVPGYRGNTLTGVRSVSINNSQYSFNVDANVPVDNWNYWYTGTSTDGITYTGTEYDQSNNVFPGDQFTKQPS